VREGRSAGRRRRHRAGQGGELAPTHHHGGRDKGWLTNLMEAGNGLTELNNSNKISALGAKEWDVTIMMNLVTA